jgi:GntR family transcriptional regulator, transcriptional repressor for pyruvate dehydrogenase complex
MTKSNEPDSERPAAALTRATAVREELLRRVASGALRPGDRLPAERTLASELGVSRNVLREAIGGLAAINLVNIQRGAGVFVRDLDVASLLEPIELAVSLAPSSLRSVIQARLVIEPGIAALAARSASPDEIDALDGLLRESAEVIDDAQAYLDADVAIHDAIVRMARNPILMRISDATRRLARASRELPNTDPELRKGSLKGHYRIFDAIVARDPAKAERAMREHLHYVDTHLFDYRADA